MNGATSQKPIQIKKIFWGWEDDKEEAWLREQANQGRHLAKVEWGQYTFVTGAPLDVVYRLDYINTSDAKKIEEYVQLFQDTGWEQVGELLGWHYFRKPYQPGQQDEIYSDPESKIEKYRRLMYLMLGILPVSFLPILNLGRVAQSSTSSPVGWVLFGLMGLILVVEVTILVRLWLRMRQLRRL